MCRQILCLTPSELAPRSLETAYLPQCPLRIDFTQQGAHPSELQKVTTSTRVDPQLQNFSVVMSVPTLVSPRRRGGLSSNTIGRCPGRISTGEHSGCPEPL
jgi:hypothetical protein